MERVRLTWVDVFADELKGDVLAEEVKDVVTSISDAIGEVENEDLLLERDSRGTSDTTIRAVRQELVEQILNFRGDMLNTGRGGFQKRPRGRVRLRGAVRGLRHRDWNLAMEQHHHVVTGQDPILLLRHLHRGRAPRSIGACRDHSR